MVSVTHTYVIAEAGVNHNGSLQMAMDLVRAAKAAGADAVKFQAFRSDALVSPRAAKAAYQSRQTDAEQSQLEMLRALELGAAEHEALVAMGREVGIDVLSSAFDDESFEMLRRLAMPLIKVPSGEITNLPFLRQVAEAAVESKTKVLLSTGMSDMDEVRDAVHVLADGGVEVCDLVLLQCTTEYPAPLEDVNLRAMLTLRETFGCDVGYSDHTQGITVPIAAVALGATIIEKHFTLDRELPGPDHSASLVPGEFSDMVRAIRQVELALGSGEKAPTNAELPNREVARKSIVASRHITEGEEFNPQNITTRRPATGISPMRWDEVVGMHAKRDFDADEEIEL